MAIRGDVIMERPLAFFEAFARRVAALDDAAWQRIAARCTSLEGESFGALVRRARVTVRPFGGPLRRPARSGFARAIASVGTAALDALGVVGELAEEFERPDAALPDRLESAAARTDDPQVRRMLLAHARMERALVPYAAAHPGMCTAVRAAGLALSQSEGVAPEELAAEYAVMEPDIPLVELQRDAGVGTPP